MQVTARPATHHPTSPTLAFTIPAWRKMSMTAFMAQVHLLLFMCRNLTERSANPNAWLPQTPAHPSATETFRRPASASNAAYADLGMWNIYLNADYPNPQANLKGFVCAAGKDCSIDQGLASTIGLFKTPVLRDLVDSAPYFHNGSRPKFQDVVAFLYPELGTRESWKATQCAAGVSVRESLRRRRKRADGLSAFVDGGL